MMKLAVMRFCLVVVVPAEANAAQDQFPETKFGRAM
jgi:hypothetical protein